MRSPVSHAAMPSVPMHVVHAFGRQLPVRARLFVEFLVERMGSLGDRNRRTPLTPG
jgi:hypothetical protein